MIIKFISDVGKAREKNEDSYTIIEDDKFLILSVADGMGGHKAGDRASQIASETIKKFFSKEKNTLWRKETDEIELLKLIFKECNNKIFTTATEIKEYHGMGTTLTVCIINKDNKKIFVGNVGDSRCYIINTLKNEINKITKDHSLVEEMIKNEEISREEAFNHPKKNIITRALGLDKKVDVDIFCNEINIKDILLLCTDGLTNHVKDNEIKELILEKNKKSLDFLVEEVNKRGGSDNTTIIMLIVEDEVENE